VFATDQEQSRDGLIVASLGNSGSTTLHAAAEVMGLRAWGPEEFAFYSTHLNPNQPAAEDWSGPASVLRSCGVKAVVADAGTLPWVRAALPHSPDAKLVLLTRAWESWVPSKMTTIARGPTSNFLLRMFSVLFLCNWLPYGLAWPWQHDEVGTSFMHSGSGWTMDMLDMCHLIGRASEASTQEQDVRMKDFRKWMGTMLKDEQAYLDAQQELRELFGPDRLLETKVGNLDYGKLAEIMGQDTAQITGPLPRTKAGGLGKAWVRVSLHPCRYAALFAFFAATAFVNWLCFCAAWRAAAAALGGGQRPKAE